MIPVSTPYVVKLLHKINELELKINDKDKELDYIRKTYNREIYTLKSSIRYYRKQRDDILKELEIKKAISFVTNDYRNNRKQIINQIKEVYK